eukprot:COSAG02_NODE_26597_length_629_cov_1.375472_1_plen_74_part_10
MFCYGWWFTLAAAVGTGRGDVDRRETTRTDRHLAAGSSRRLIGVIQAIPSVSWVAAHPSNVSSLPFDGISILAD